MISSPGLHLPLVARGHLCRSPRDFHRGRTLRLRGRPSHPGAPGAHHGARRDPRLTEPVRLLRGVYEGPQSYGILRMATSIRGVHTLLRALPGEAYFPTLYGASGANRGDGAGHAQPTARASQRTRWRQGTSPATSPVSSGVTPKAEIVILARSEASLLSEESIPVTTLPEAEETGRSPGLVTFPWEATGHEGDRGRGARAGGPDPRQDAPAGPRGAHTLRSTSSGHRSSGQARRPSTPRPSGSST